MPKGSPAPEKPRESQWDAGAPLASSLECDLDRGMVQARGRRSRFALADEVVNVRIADVLVIAAAYLGEAARRGGVLPASPEQLMVKSGLADAGKPT